MWINRIYYKASSTGKWRPLKEGKIQTFSLSGLQRFRQFGHCLFHRLSIVFSRGMGFHDVQVTRLYNWRALAWALFLVGSSTHALCLTASCLIYSSCRALETIEISFCGFCINHRTSIITVCSLCSLALSHFMMTKIHVIVTICQVHWQPGVDQMLPLLHHIDIFRGLAREKRLCRRHHWNVRRIQSSIPTNVG